MRLAFFYDAVYPRLAGGGEKSLYELAIHLRDRGHECHLFAMHGWDGPAEMLHDGLHYHAVCPWTPLYRPDGRRRAAQPARYALGVLAALASRSWRTFDLLDVHAFPLAHLPALLTPWRRLRAAGVPWSLTWLEVWGPDYWREHFGPLAGWGARVERWAARAAPSHLCISPTTARRLRELLGAPEDRITVIPRGFDAAPLAALRSPRAPGKILLAGRLRAYKRVDLALRAWPRVIAARPDATLHLVGDGPEAARCRALVAELGLARSVVLHGQLADAADVRRHLASAELLLLPSTREGQSTVVLEAMALGTPVLAADGPETAVGDFLGRDASAAGVLLPAKADADAWAAQIVGLLGDPPLRARLGAEGRRRAADLAWDSQIAPRVEAYYRDTIARQRGPRTR